MNIVKPRADRNDSEKTYWDPIGILFVPDEVDVSEVKFFGQIYSIGDINVFPQKPKTDGPF